MKSKNDDITSGSRPLFKAGAYPMAVQGSPDCSYYCNQPRQESDNQITCDSAKNMRWESVKAPPVDEGDNPLAVRWSYVIGFTLMLLACFGCVMGYKALTSYLNNQDGKDLEYQLPRGATVAPNADTPKADTPKPEINAD